MHSVSISHAFCRMKRNQFHIGQNSLLLVWKWRLFAASNNSLLWLLWLLFECFSELTSVANRNVFHCEEFDVLLSKQTHWRLKTNILLICWNAPLKMCFSLIACIKSHNCDWYEGFAVIIYDSKNSRRSDFQL